MKRTCSSCRPPRGCEHKILRSAVSGFNVERVLQAALAEEAIAGWRMVEKLDGGRIRLERPRGFPTPAGVDAWREWYGENETAMTGRFFAAYALMLACVLAGAIALVSLATILLLLLRR